MASSNIKPTEIEVDWSSLKHDKVDILVHWNIEEKEFIDEYGNTQIYYEYQERRMELGLAISHE